MASAAPILCVMGNNEEAGQFQNALASIKVSNPAKCVVGASEAIALLEGGLGEDGTNPILVFLSLTTPEANRLAAWFEAHPKNRAAAVIALTGFQDMRPIIQAYHLGVTAFLEWPIKSEDVRNALKTNSNIAIQETSAGLLIQRAKA